MAKEAPRIPDDWIADFEAAARRPLEVHLRYSFIKTYKPVLDDAPYRSFESMEEYRRWCEANLPAWLGYGRTATESTEGTERVSHASTAGVDLPAGTEPTEGSVERS